MDNRLQWFLPKAWKKKLQRRTVGIPGRKLYALPFLEWRALWKIRNGKNRETVLYQRNKSFQEQIPQRLIDAADIVIGFDTSSWILQERCRKAGKKFILDASIAHPLSQQDVFAGLRKRFAAWQGQLQAKNPELIAIELKEMQQADAIVVASEFTKATYTQHGIDAERIYINHYGTDLEYFKSKWGEALVFIHPLNPPPAGDSTALEQQHPQGDSTTLGQQNLKENNSSPELHTFSSGIGNSKTAKKVRFLYFSKLAVRKGFPWLCEIWEGFHGQFPGTKLVAAGYGQLPAGFKIPHGVEMQGFVHPADRLGLFHSADVFVFPSYFEGFAQVIIEAMACGLPVITTTHTVGPEIITNGDEGFCIEPGDDAALFNAMQFFADHPEQIELMGKKARKRVEEMTWEMYGERWREICDLVMSDAHPANRPFGRV
jgi:glycosyltransferase involved in cell wall biosynthesis